MGSKNYGSIKDATKAVGGWVTLVGIVVECGIPQRSKSINGEPRDFFCSLKIKDESYQDNRLTVCVFGKSIEQLPRVRSAGDIAYFSDVVMQDGGGTVSARFRKNSSTFALFEGKSAQNFIPYHASSNFQPMLLDQSCITSLRSWLLTWELDSGGSHPLTSLKEIKEGIPVDIICKIVKVHHEPSSGYWVVYLWDGTDAPPISFPSNWNTNFKDPKLLHVEESSLPRDVLCGFPPVGTVLRVVIQSEKVIGSRISCAWVRFVMLVCEERYGLWNGIWSSKTNVNILSEEDINVIRCKRAYDERLLKWGNLPLSALPWDSRISERTHKQESFVTLRNVLTHSQATHKFKCVVRFVAIHPSTVESLWSALNGSSRIRVILEDPTARICISLPAEYKVRFFGNCSSVSELSHKFNELVGIPEEDGVPRLGACRNPPWVPLGLMYHHNKNDTVAGKKRKITDTTEVA